MKDLAGKSVIVTGACGGIGRKAVEIFAGYGMHVVATDISESVMEIASDLTENGMSVSSEVTDVTNEGDAKSLVELCVKKFEKLDCAFNNAGIEQSNKPLHELTIEEWQRALDVDLTGVFLGLKFQCLAMMEAGGGSIVNTASALGKVAIPNASEYVAAKHGVVGLTRAAAIDYATSGIRINAVCPGVIETPMISRLSEDENFVAIFDRLRAQHPIGRFGRPEEVCEAAAWLFSDKASLMTGAALSADGGYTVI